MSETTIPDRSVVAESTSVDAATAAAAAAPRAAATTDATTAEPSKNALKKAAKRAEKPKKEKKEKQASAAPKAPKKKLEGAALIGIDVSKEENFPDWYQQVLSKGDMLDYYDVSGCFILKVGSLPFFFSTLILTLFRGGGGGCGCASGYMNVELLLTVFSAPLILHLGDHPGLLQQMHPQNGRQELLLPPLRL